MNAKNNITVVAEQELYRACRIIFGPNLSISRGFLQYVQRGGVKSAYRKRALEIHPDRLVGQGEFARRRGARIFQSVQQAYQNLNIFLDARESGYTFGPRLPVSHFSARTGKAGAVSRPSQKRTSTPNRKNRPSPLSRACRADKKYQGPIPAMKLLFGHYLYYSGLISRQTVVKALIWQKNQNPRLGEIGRRHGWLRNWDILRILKYRDAAQPFGRSAVHLGLLTQGELMIMLSEQARLKKKIGAYFVDKKILTSRQLAVLLEQCRKHNAQQTSSSFTRGL